MRWKPFLCMMAAALFLIGTAELATARSSGAEPEILRLHVVANSDSLADQAIKLRVRDAILAYEAGRGGPKSAGALRQDLLEDGAGLLNAVNGSLFESGAAYGAKLALGRYQFPARSYAGADYPAGEYMALRVVLGRGAGQNWWCVLFPPLCILELPDGEIEDKEMHSLILKLWKEGMDKDDSDG